MLFALLFDHALEVVAQADRELGATARIVLGLVDGMEAGDVQTETIGHVVGEIDPGDDDVRKPDAMLIEDGGLDRELLGHLDVVVRRHPPAVFGLVGVVLGVEAEIADGQDRLGGDQIRARDGEVGHQDFDRPLLVADGAVEFIAIVGFETDAGPAVDVDAGGVGHPSHGLDDDTLVGDVEIVEEILVVDFDAAGDLEVRGRRISDGGLSKGRSGQNESGNRGSGKQESFQLLYPSLYARSGRLG